MVASLETDHSDSRLIDGPEDDLVGDIIAPPDQEGSDRRFASPARKLAMGEGRSLWFVAVCTFEDGEIPLPERHPQCPPRLGWFWHVRTAPR